jgi:aldose 1-epimerase
LFEDEKVGVFVYLFQSAHGRKLSRNLNVSCLYSLNNDNELSIDYFANTDQTTIVNLTNHTYFNLNGGKSDILDHELVLSASQYTEAVDMIPTGNILPVEGTPFDFTPSNGLGRI